MAASTPRYLFRCWSDQSNGTNTPTLFASAGLDTTSTDTSISEHNQDFISLRENPSTTTTLAFATQLRQALLWKKDQAPCPFVFFTTSPIFVIQLAVWRNARKEYKDGTVVEPDTGIHISIIDTQTAKTAEGWPVRFQSVSDLLRIHGVELRNRGDGGVREYADQWVATTNVVVGEGSHYAGLGEMVRNGLFELYPQIEAANARRDPRVSLTTDDLRKYFFGAGGGSFLVSESLDTAERVAMCFTPKTTDGGDRDMGLLMAFVLSLRKRDLKDLAFKSWLEDHTDDLLHAVDDDAEIVVKGSGGTSDIPDAEEFVRLCQKFSSRNFQVGAFGFGLSIDPTRIEKEKAEWARWWRSNREAYRASHPREQQQGWRHRHTNRPQQLLERRARRDSVVVPPRPPMQHCPRPWRTPEPPRELFPEWRRSGNGYGHYTAAPRHEVFDRRPYLAELSSRRREEGYRVLSSRPGDATVTRQQNRHAKVVRRRDVDGTYVRRLGGR